MECDRHPFCRSDVLSSPARPQHGFLDCFFFLLLQVHRRHRYPTCIPAFSEYNVGLALLRLGKIMSAASGDTDDGVTDSNDAGSSGGRREMSAHPAVDCRVAEKTGHGEGGQEPRRFLPLTPPWWPEDLDPNTGKVPS